MTHPARFTPSIIDAIGQLLTEERKRRPSKRKFKVFDPCAGDGRRLGSLCLDHGWSFTGVDIEPWGDAIANVHQYDSTDLPHHVFLTGEYDAIVTSVTYANGLSDKGLNMADPKGRRTYDLALGRPLHANNTGRYGLRQGKAAYREYLRLHGLIYRECFRVAKVGAPFLLNVSDVVHGLNTHPVGGDNLQLAQRAGWVYERFVPVSTPRYGFGANAEARADHEKVYVLRKMGSRS